MASVASAPSLPQTTQRLPTRAPTASLPASFVLQAGRLRAMAAMAYLSRDRDGLWLVPSTCAVAAAADAGKVWPSTPGAVFKHAQSLLGEC